MNKLDVDSDMYRIVGCAMKVYNTLKHGYQESIYERSLEIELQKNGFSVRRQVRFEVFYDNQVAGVHVLDMVVNDHVVVELKAVNHLGKAHEEQVQSYLKSSGYKEGLLMNFGNLRRLEWRAYGSP